MPKKQLPPPPLPLANSPGINPADLPELDLTALDEEIRNEAKYGDRPIEAAVRGAAEAATFGASTPIEQQLLGTTPEQQREVQERSPVAAGVGTAAGIVGPALATMGRSVPAQAASAGVRALTATGLAAEKAAAAALAPRIGSTAAKIAGKFVGGATEGAAVGAGQLASEIAKERADLSGESLAAHVGVSALVSGGFGVTLGTAQASLPKLKEFGKSAAKKLGGIAEASTETLANPGAATTKILTANDTDALSLTRVLGDDTVETALPKFVKEELQLGDFTTPRQLYNRNKQVMQEAGEQIGAITKQLDNMVEDGQVLLTRREAYQPLINRLDEEAAKYGGNATKTARRRMKEIAKTRQGLVEIMEDEKPFKFFDFDADRRTYQKDSYGAVGQKEGFKAELADLLRAESRNVIDDLATKASDVVPDLASGLKAANERYHISANIEPKLEKLVGRQPSILEPLRLLYDTTRRVARNVAVTNDIAAKVTNLKSTVAKSVDDFFKPASLAAKKSLPSTLASTQILTASLLSRDLRTDKQPKTKAEAFTNLQNNVSEVVTNPEKMVDILAKKTARVASANPAVGGALQTTLVNAVQFLSSKIPKPTTQPGMFKRPYQPTSMELAKLERYMQIIEKPLSALKELEQGTLTREHVEALKAVYPAIYQEIQMAAVDQVAKNPQLPYAKKVQISILLDVPADSSLSGESVMMLQQSISGSEEAQAEDSQGSQGGGGGNSTAKPTMTGLKGIDVAGREATNVQELQSAE